MNSQTAYRCPRCGGRASLVKAPGRGARKFQCQEAACRYEQLPFTLAQERRRKKSEEIAANRIGRAAARPHWTHETYG